MQRGGEISLAGGGDSQRREVKQETILIRADANVAMGTGHVMRCLALAQAWQDTGAEAVFAIGEAPSALEQRVVSEGFSVLHTNGPPGSLADAASTEALARKLDAAWVVVDGDRFDVAFLASVRASGRRIILLDDFASRESFPADLVVNPNLGTNGEEYGNKIATDALLLGPSYVFLRREFTSVGTKRAFPETGRRILVTLGGSDPENLAPQMAKAVATLPATEVTVVVGPGYQHAIDSTNHPDGGFVVVRNPSNLRQFMESADLAVIAGGGTLWELLYLGCAVLSYARNPVQQRIVDELARRRALRDLGATTNFDAAELAMSVAEVMRTKSLRMQMAETGQQVLDGRGAARVVDAMRNFRGRG